MDYKPKIMRKKTISHHAPLDENNLLFIWNYPQPLGSDCVRARGCDNDARNCAQYVMRNGILRTHLKASFWKHFWHLNKLSFFFRPFLLYRFQYDVSCFGPWCCGSSTSQCNRQLITDIVYPSLLFVCFSVYCTSWNPAVFLFLSANYADGSALNLSL